MSCKDSINYSVNLGLHFLFNAGSTIVMKE